MVYDQLHWCYNSYTLQENWLNIEYKVRVSGDMHAKTKVVSPLIW